MNYSFKSKKELPKISDGHVFEICNFHQLFPNTVIFEGIKNLTFRKCNLINCLVPSDAVIEGCLYIQINYCKNLHPDYVNLLDEEIECLHFISKDELIIDDELIETVYQYKDQVI